MDEDDTASLIVIFSSQPIQRPNEAEGSRPDRTIKNYDQKHNVQICAPLSMLNKLFAGVFRPQAHDS